MYLSNFIVFFTEDSKPEPDDPLNDIDADKVPSACDQSTQTEVVDLSAKPSEVDTTNGEELINPSQDETDI